MKNHSGIKLVFPVLLALAAGACGGGDDSPSNGDRIGTSQPRNGAASKGLQTIVGAPVSASATEVVIDTEDGERRFTIAAEDVTSVDPEHINSHVGIANLAFRISYRSEDGVDRAVAAEEVDLQTEPVDQTR